MASEEEINLRLDGNAYVDGETLVLPPSKRPLRVLVSSTVYGKEDFLERIYQLLVGLGYDVEMSYAGTIKVDSDKTAFDNCLAAVERCDLFLGVITTSYGSGVGSGSEFSITHQEIKRAIELKKKRWMLVDSRVPFIRNWLNSIGIKGRTKRREFAKKLVEAAKPGKLRSPFEFGKNAFDMRTIDMYEDAIKDYEGPNKIPVDERIGNWVQPYADVREVERFVVSQFSSSEQAIQLIKESSHGES